MPSAPDQRLVGTAERAAGITRYTIGDADNFEASDFQVLGNKVQRFLFRHNNGLIVKHQVVATHMRFCQGLGYVNHIPVSHEVG